MQIDLYLGFTSCRWHCLFCKQGEDLIYFPRPTYMSDPTQYQFFYFNTSDDLYSWIATTTYENIDTINISGNDPISWIELSLFLDILTEKYPSVYRTLRISNTRELDQKICTRIDAIELSLYWHTPEIQLAMTGTDESWDIFHSNLAEIRASHRVDVQLQTIFLYTNIAYASSILEYMLSLSGGQPIKIVYPHFMPRNMVHELIPKREFLQLLIRQVPKNILQKCIMNNIKPQISLTSLFYDIQE